MKPKTKGRPIPRDLENFLPIKDPQTRAVVDRLKERILQLRPGLQFTDRDLLIEETEPLQGLAIMTRKRCVCTRRRKEKGELSHPLMHTFAGHEGDVLTFVRLNQTDPKATCPYGAKRGTFFENVQDFMRYLSWGFYMHDYAYTRDRVEMQLDDELEVFDYASGRTEQLRGMLRYIAQGMPGIVDFLVAKESISPALGMLLRRLVREIGAQVPVLVRYDLLHEPPEALPVLVALQRPELDEEGQAKFKLFRSPSALVDFAFATDKKGEDGGVDERYNWLFRAPMVILRHSTDITRHLTANRTICGCHLRRDGAWALGTRNPDDLPEPVHVPMRWEGQRRLNDYFQCQSPYTQRQRKRPLSPKKIRRGMAPILPYVRSPRDTLSNWPQCLECIPMNSPGQRDIRRYFGGGAVKERTSDATIDVVIKTKVRALTRM